MATTFEPVERPKVMNRATIFCADSRLDTEAHAEASPTGEGQSRVSKHSTGFRRCEADSE